MNTEHSTPSNLAAAPLRPIRLITTDDSTAADPSRTARFGISEDSLSRQTPPDVHRIQHGFASGDENVLAECQRRYGPLLHAYAARYVGPDDAEDVVQTVMIEAWRRRERYDPTRPLEAWLLTITRRRAIDRLRTQKTVVDLATIKHITGEDGREIADRFVWAFQIRQALGQLPEAQREAITLSYFGGLSQTQIATHLDVPLGTIKTRTKRGLERLAELLGTGYQTPRRIDPTAPPATA
jgi:RNA polymerase sigma factor (sigma-70 family)